MKTETHGPRIELPDPFVFENGRWVASPADWKRRRLEIRDLLLDIEYGHAPPSTGRVTAVAAAPWQPQHAGRSSTRDMTLAMGPPKSRLSVRMRISVPRGREKKPSPAVLRIGLGCPITGELTERGYALVEFEPRDLAPDAEGNHALAGPARQAYPDCDWGALAVWAWGASRVMDHLETCAWVRADQTVITGHSRFGKAALLCGALDERFTVTVPNGSGCGGASCYRVLSPDSETLEMITRPSRFAAWFRKDFRRFAEREQMLPFDQHYLRALIAPRAVLNTEALGDLWANPRGAQAGYLGAHPVFGLLGALHNNGIHFRDGQHDQLAEDFRALLDFADWKFKGREPARNFARLPFPDVCPTFSGKK
ncbi:MAG: hypothetical protein GXP31_18955 [Kiritimatiellaeota bacterium]|nr:hypothetical protein [Kiritimatiellota bacterium]